MPNGTLAKFLDPNRTGSLAHRARQHRNDEFRRRFPGLANMRVLDLGGTPAYWRASTLKPHSVTIVNLEYEDDSAESWMEVLRADACGGGFGEFDLVFSNSLIEHVGGHAKRQELADVIRESAPNWWVQTPNRYFPIEPHWLFPGFQFLPFPARVKVAQHWGGHFPVFKDHAEAAKAVAWTELVSATEMRAYFPESEIWVERFAGMPKSLVSVKSGDNR